MKLAVALVNVAAGAHVSPRTMRLIVQPLTLVVRATGPHLDTFSASLLSVPFACVHGAIVELVCHLLSASHIADTLPRAGWKREPCPVMIGVRLDSNCRLPAGLIGALDLKHIQYSQQAKQNDRIRIPPPKQGGALRPPISHIEQKTQLLAVLRHAAGSVQKMCQKDVTRPEQCAHVIRVIAARGINALTDGITQGKATAKHRCV